MKLSCTGSFSQSIAVLLSVAVLTACSTFGSREAAWEEAERFIDYAGDPIDSFSYLGRLDRWRAIGRDRLVVWTGLNDAYLLTVGGGCFDLQSATSIGVTSRTGTDVSRGFDSVVLPRNQRCTISEIRPIDYKRMKDDERAMHGE